MLCSCVFAGSSSVWGELGGDCLLPPLAVERMTSREVVVVKSVTGDVRDGRVTDGRSDCQGSVSSLVKVDDLGRRAGRQGLQ